MNGEHARSDAEVLADAAAAVAAAVAAVPNQGAQHHLTHAQVLALQAQAQAVQEQELTDAYNPPEQQVQLRKPRKLRKPNDVARCQVDGCGRDLSDAKLYLRRYSVCEPHFKAEWVMLSGGRYRFCQQCNKFQPLDNFAGNRRSCKSRSEDRNLRRRKQRTDERAAAGDEADTLAGRLLKGGHAVGGLALPSRAALGDNGMLRQLGADPSDAASQLAAMQYASQVQQLLLAGGAGAMGPGLGPGGAGVGMSLQVPGGVDLAALVSGELNALSGGAPNANALSLLTAAASANGRTGSTPLASLAEPSAMGGPSAMLQQLQLAQLASALSKGAGGAAAGGGGSNGGASASGLAAALGGVGLNGLGLGAGGLGAGLSGGNLTQQLLAQQVATSTAAGGSGGGASGSGGIGAALGDGGAFAGNLDLQSLMTQQLLQQSVGTPNQAPPVLLLHNQNVMLLSLEPLGLLGQQQPK